MDYLTEIEVYSSFDAAKHLGEMFGKQLPDLNRKTKSDFNATVERIMQGAIDHGVTLRGDELRKAVEKRLKPHYRLFGDPE